MLSAISVTQSQPGRPCWADIVRSNLGTSRVEALGGEDGFLGQLTLWSLGYLRVAHVKLKGTVVRGMRRRTSGGRQAYSWVAASLGGAFELSYNGRSAVIEPGQLAILDARRTYVTTFAADNEVLWVRVPHAFLAAHFARPTQIIIDGASGAGRLVLDTLRSITSQTQCLHPGQGRPIADGLISIIAAAGLCCDEVDEEARNRSAGTLQRVKAFVLDNLSDDSLSATSVAVANGLSPRYINKLFEQEGSSLMRWVWRQRLEAARAALAGSELAPPSVSSLAYAYGFKSASHFSHAFRRHFGCAPRTQIRSTLGGS